MSTHSYLSSNKEAKNQTPNYIKYEPCIPKQNGKDTTFVGH